MTSTARRVATVLAICLLAVSVPAYAVSCLIFPLSCLKSKKKYGDEMEATVLDLRSSRTEHYLIAPGAVTSNAIEDTRTWYIWFKVGETLYQGQRTDTILTMMFNTANREEWIGKTAPIRFLDKKWMGMKGALVLFERENGKEWEFAVVSVVGPDGVDECAGRVFCPQQAEIDRPAREAEQLAQLAKTGAKSASDVESMPVEIPKTTAAAPEAAAPTSAPGPAAPEAAMPTVEPSVGEPAVEVQPTAAGISTAEASAEALPPGT